MRDHVTVQDQYAAATQDDLRILVVGAGVAGVTIAQLLRREGRHPVLVERNPDGGHPGYMLALMPMVDRVFADLGVRDLYRQSSVEFSRYAVHGHTGKLLRVSPLANILRRYGEYRGLARGELLDVLTSRGCAVAFGATVTAWSDGLAAAEVTFATPSGSCQAAFDLVIVADGIHSATRSLVLGEQSLSKVDTHWGGWVVWAPPDESMDLGEELWGTGCFLGVYPVKDQIGIFLGGGNADTAAGAAAFVATMRRTVKAPTPRLARALDAVLADPDPFYWPLTDIRSPRWVSGRAVLLGDAATGFLPTAGIGAGMAMESAWVLARVLRQATRENVAMLLRSYESAQRPRVEAAQDNSRGLARMMFRHSVLLAVLRDLVTRLVSVKVAIRPIRKLLNSAPDPDAIATAAHPTPAANAPR